MDRSSKKTNANNVRGMKNIAGNRNKWKRWLAGYRARMFKYIMTVIINIVFPFIVIDRF